ncbi:MAG: heat-inducible transcription repressor HrcA [Clostridia bacterium]|nr:heat-inducible transcription repressor HrcA [Clostridia bacterium]
MDLYGDGLSDRKKQILKAIVEAHIQGGEPVGSKYIMESKQLSCSSATIRNEMAELENMGLLEQPHTSAGRVPSKQGYRFYVDSLLEEYAMTAKEIAQINQLMKVKMSELDRILDNASKVASSLTNYTGFAIKPRSRSITVKRFETALIDSHSFILILVASDGSVKTRNIFTDTELDTHVISALSEALNELVADHEVGEITLPIIMSLEARMAGDSALVNTVMKSIYEVIGELDGGELKVSGLDRLLQYPEFSDSDELGQLLGAFEQKDAILDLVTDTDEDRVNVVIGSESSVKVINNSTLVFKPIKSKGKTVGAIGVIGPLRMDYARVLATLDNLGGNITQLLSEPKHQAKGDNHDG